MQTNGSSVATDKPDVARKHAVIAPRWLELAHQMVSELPLEAMRGRVSHLDITHDSGCPIHHGGICGCDPDFYLYEDGSAKRTKLV